MSSSCVAKHRFASVFQFVSIETTSQFLRETKCFASLEDSLGFLALYDLAESSFKSIRKKFGRNFSSIFSFLMFPVAQTGFFVVSSWGKWFSSLMSIPLGIFWHCKIENLTKGTFAYVKNFTFSKLEPGADVGRSRLVSA